MPIVCNGHGLLGVIKLNEKFVGVDSNSRHRKSSEIWTIFQDWLVDCYVPKKVIASYSHECKKVVQQTNARDCGVFVMMFMKALTMNPNDYQFKMTDESRTVIEKEILQYVMKVRTFINQ